MISRINVLGVGISAIAPQRVIELMVDWIESRQKHYICVCAVHVVMECQRDPALRAMVNRASLAVPDGMPLVWLARLDGQHHVRRVYGPDLTLAFCDLAARIGYRNYLLGGAPGQPEILAQRLRARFQGLDIVGTHATPHRPLPAAENEMVLEEINHLEPDVVWVGMGTNVQERWMAENRHLLNAPVLVGVGAAFDFHSNMIPQAPAAMQRVGLEWLFRLIQEPRRLWRRYLLGNPLFLAKVISQKMGLRHYELPEEGEPESGPDPDGYGLAAADPAADWTAAQRTVDRAINLEDEASL
jgi:N-acetylglucosaminyldiphosphoundecaprenol N-acetyl-beta-D-mannosaminyltransferase